MAGSGLGKAPELVDMHDSAFSKVWPLPSPADEAEPKVNRGTSISSSECPSCLEQTQFVSSSTSAWLSVCLLFSIYGAPCLWLLSWAYPEGSISPPAAQGAGVPPSVTHAGALVNPNGAAMVWFPS